MHFDLAAIPQSDAYKLLVSTVVPRPIALATTVDRDGRVNAAPFSFFNAVSSVPPVVVLGISPGDPNAPTRCAWWAACTAAAGTRAPATSF